jgi:hypothetical protein
VFAERGYQKFALLHGTLTNDVEIIISVPSWGGAPEAHEGSEGPSVPRSRLHQASRPRCSGDVRGGTASLVNLGAPYELLLHT